MTRRSYLLLSVFACAVATLTACRRSEPESREVPAENALLVFAAVSLRDVFTELGKEFEQDHPGVHVTFNFAGTQELRTQLEHGAPADVFASADQRHMKEMVEAKRVSAPVVFARNEPLVVVATSARATVSTFVDLPRAARIVVGTPEVPIGRYTAQILERAGKRLGADFKTEVEAKVVSRELNVRQVLAKVSLGEADAGIVYRTDVASAKGKVEVVPIPAELNVIAEYPIALVTEAVHPKLGGDWIQLVSSAAGQNRLRAAGFLAPSD